MIFRGSTSLGRSNLKRAGDKKATLLVALGFDGDIPIFNLIAPGPAIPNTSFLLNFIYKNRIAYFGHGLIFIKPAVIISRPVIAFGWHSPAALKQGGGNS